MIKASIISPRLTINIYLMKYILRYTITNHYTDNQQKINSEDLIDTLRSHKFPYTDRWEELV